MFFEQEHNSLLEQHNAERKNKKQQRKMQDRTNAVTWSVQEFFDNILRYEPGSSLPGLVFTCIDPTFFDVHVPKFLAAYMRTLEKHFPHVSDVSSAIPIIRSHFQSPQQLQDKYAKKSASSSTSHIYAKIRDYQIQALLRITVAVYDPAFVDPMPANHIQYLYLQLLNPLCSYFDKFVREVHDDAHWNKWCTKTNSFRNFLKRTLLGVEEWNSKMPQTIATIFKLAGFAVPSALQPKKSDEQDSSDPLQQQQQPKQQQQSLMELEPISPLTPITPSALQLQNVFMAPLMQQNQRGIVRSSRRPSKYAAAVTVFNVKRNALKIESPMELPLSGMKRKFDEMAASSSDQEYKPINKPEEQKGFVRPLKKFKFK